MWGATTELLAKAMDAGNIDAPLTEEDAEQIRTMVRNEDSYFALFDFVDIVLELMVRNPDPGAFSRSVKMIRAIIASLIEELDFSHAAFLMDKFSGQAHPGLTDAHRNQLREMLASFTDKQTLHVLKVFLIDRKRRVRNIYNSNYVHPAIALADLETLLMEEAG